MTGMVPGSNTNYSTPCTRSLSNKCIQALHQYDLGLSWAACNSNLARGRDLNRLDLEHRPLCYKETRSSRRRSTAELRLRPTID
jgi:hypothetical protein